MNSTAPSDVVEPEERARMYGAAAGWWPVAFLGVLFVYHQLSDLFYWAFEPSLLLPYLFGWLAWRIGSAAFAPLLLVSPLVLLSIRLQYGSLTAGLGMGVEVFALCMLAALAFCRPPLWERAGTGLTGDDGAAQAGSDGVPAPWTRVPWHRLRWGVAVALWLAIFPSWQWHGELGGLEVETNPGLLLLAVLLAASVRWRRGWRALLAAMRHRGPAMTLVLCVAACAGVALLPGLAFAVHLSSDYDVGLHADFGLDRPSTLLALLVLVPVLVGAVGWPWMLLGVLVFQGAGFATVLATGGADGGAGAGLYPVMILEATLRLVALTAVAGALGPFWRSAGARTAPPRATLLALGVALVVAAADGRFLGGLYGTTELVLAMACLLGGLGWGLRGAIALPLAVPIAWLIGAFAAGADAHPAQFADALGRAAFTLFPHGLFGVLAARLRRPVDPS